MQFEIKPYTVPDQIEFNYEELKKELVEKTEMYKTMVYTEEQIKEAKADRALLNKTRTALNDERIRVQKLYMKPFDDFKAKVDDLISTINGAASVIDSQIKDYEELEKKEKEKNIRELFTQCGFQPCVTLEKIWNPKWLNKSCSMKQIEQEMNDRKYRISTDLLTLGNLPEKEIAVEYYKKSLDINEAIRAAQEHAELEKRKAEAVALAEERKAVREREEAAVRERQEQRSEEAAARSEDAAQKTADGVRRMWIGFKAYLSMEEAGKLKMFLDSLGIDYEPINIKED